MAKRHLRMKKEMHQVCIQWRRRLQWRRCWGEDESI